MGTAAGVEQMYRELGPMIYARCCRMLRNRAQAEDATQDIFVKLMRSTMPTTETRWRWVHRVTVNHCLNVLRDMGTRPALATSEIPDTASEVDLEQSVVEEDFSRQLLKSMPRHLTIPAVLYHQRGINQEAIARSLGISRRTVLHRLAEFRCRAERFAVATA